MKRLAVLVLLLPLAPGGWRRRGGRSSAARAGRGELTVLAAASLTDVFDELATPSRRSTTST